MLNLGAGCYLKDKFTSLIDKSKVKLIFEIGSRDCLDAIDLNNYYNCKVYAFECNPMALRLSKNNIKKNNISKNKIELIDKAIYNENKTIKFYPVIKTLGVYEENKELFKIENQKYGNVGDISNIGASSIFKFNKQHEVDKYGHTDHHQQKEIDVDAIRLDTFINTSNIDVPDLICMDLQGSELMALQGLSNYLSKVKYIITELLTAYSYEEQGDIKDVIELLENNGFELKVGNLNSRFVNDFLFINKNI